MLGDIDVLVTLTLLRYTVWNLQLTAEKVYGASSVTRSGPCTARAQEEEMLAGPEGSSAAHHGEQEAGNEGEESKAEEK